MTLANCIEATARRQPGAPAVLFGDLVISYAQFAAEIRRVAAGLARDGLRPGDRLGVRIGHPYWHWLLLLAGLRLGARSLSVSSAWAQELPGVGGLELLVHDEAVWDLGPATARRALSDAWVAEQAARPVEGLPESEAADAALGRYIFSSGTTGHPKGVLLDEQQLTSRTNRTIATYGLGPDSRLRMGLGIESIAGFQNPLSVWRAGGALVILSSAAAAPAEIERHRPTIFLTSPHGLEQLMPLMPEGRAGPPPLVVSIGGRLPVALRDRFVARVDCRLAVLYGSTEAGLMAWGDASLLDRHPGACGFAGRDVAIEIVDAGGSPLPVGVEGEVRTRTSGMAAGYVDRPRGASSLRDGWFYPGDRGVLFPDGMLAVTGRTADTLNIGGIKLDPLAIEAAAAGSPAVVESCAIALPREGGTDDLAVAVVLRPGEDLSAVRIHLRQAMPQLTRFRLVGVSALPRNAMGKVARAELAAALAQQLRDPA